MLGGLNQKFNGQFMPEQAAAQSPPTSAPAEQAAPSTGQNLAQPNSTAVVEASPNVTMPISARVQGHHEKGPHEKGMLKILFRKHKPTLVSLIIVQQTLL